MLSDIARSIFGKQQHVHIADEALHNTNEVPCGEITTYSCITGFTWVAVYQADESLCVVFNGVKRIVQC